VCTLTFHGPKISRALVTISQYFSHFRPPAGTLVRMLRNSSSVTASSPIPIMSTPRALKVSSRSVLRVGGATRIDSGVRTRWVIRWVMSQVSR
jgi:hypothetical protein